MDNDGLRNHHPGKDDFPGFRRGLDLALRDLRRIFAVKRMLRDRDPLFFLPVVSRKRMKAHILDRRRIR